MPNQERKIYSFMDEGAQEFENAVFNMDYEKVIEMLRTTVSANYLDYDDMGLGLLLIESNNPEFADKVITFVEENELGWIWSEGRDRIEPMRYTRNNYPKMLKVLLKHKKRTPLGNVNRIKMNYDLRSESNAEEAEKYSMVRDMEEIAYYYHFDSLRKDYKTGYYEHPKAVVKMLEEFGVTDPLTLAIAWGHDLIEEEKISDSVILRGVFQYGEKILEGLKKLTFQPDRAYTEELKAEQKMQYIRNLAKNSKPEILLVKIADRLCNTLDFIELSGVDEAFEYLKKGSILFENRFRLTEKFSIAVEKKLQEVENKLGKKLTISK